MQTPSYWPLLNQHRRQQVQFALEEDLGPGDVTAQLLDTKQKIKALLISREPGLLCGKDWVDEVFVQLAGQQVNINWLVEEGGAVSEDQVLAEISGPAPLVLSAERTALNFLQSLMGTAKTVSHYLKQLPDGYLLLDTRKTIPGMRLAQKYAVWLAGGSNHRLALYDQFLIKENHIAAAGSLERAVVTARSQQPDLKIEVEVETLEQLDQAIALDCDYIMLDNFSTEMLQAAWQRNFRAGQLEISGGYSLEDLAALPKPNNLVRLSIGALTKHLQAHDLSLRIIPSTS